jgi:hypothetical protein
VKKKLRTGSPQNKRKAPIAYENQPQDRAWKPDSEKPEGSKLITSSVDRAKSRHSPRMVFFVRCVIATPRADNVHFHDPHGARKERILAGKLLRPFSQYRLDKQYKASFFRVWKKSPKERFRAGAQQPVFVSPAVCNSVCNSVCIETHCIPRFPIITSLIISARRGIPILGNLIPASAR